MDFVAKDLSKSNYKPRGTRSTRAGCCFFPARGLTRTRLWLVANQKPSKKQEMPAMQSTWESICWGWR